MSESRVMGSFWSVWGDFWVPGELDLGFESCVRFGQMSRPMQTDGGEQTGEAGLGGDPRAGMEQIGEKVCVGIIF